ncbi:pilus assembly protein TadG-related protein [Asanoa sp. NPDC050611]|uniref:pilus assembly protein TadG-related protein n=1 Tax=Asanoa sp. NPDC050611 TaxID=3157098 RepID=UPI003411B5F2
MFLKRQGDRGAVGALTVVLFGTGVLLAVSALVVDIGLIYAERKQLQTGADAAAVSAAQVCATDAARCGGPDLDRTATAYARNNETNAEAAATVCGRGGDLPACPTGSADQCARPAPETGAYAEVHTRIQRADGSNLLPPVFAQAVLDDYDGAAVTACARVAWGPPAAARTFGLAISTCDWQRMTGRGGRLPSVEQPVPLYDETDPAACGRRGLGDGNQGGFRWLAGTRDCRAAVSTTRAVEVTRPGERPDDCLDLLEELVATPDRAIAVPVFARVSDDGGYTVRGVAAFVVTGWRLPDSVEPSPRLGRDCPEGASTCVFGYFTRAVVPGGGAVGGPDLGAQITTLIG